MPLTLKSLYPLTRFISEHPANALKLPFCDCLFVSHPLTRTRLVICGDLVEFNRFVYMQIIDENVPVTTSSTLIFFWEFKFIEMVCYLIGRILVLLKCVYHSLIVRLIKIKLVYWGLTSYIRYVPDLSPLPPTDNARTRTHSRSYISKNIIPDKAEHAAHSSQLW